MTEPMASATARRGSASVAASIALGEEAMALPDERGDHGEVPHHGRGVGEEEVAMAVEDAETPGGEHESAAPGKECGQAGWREGVFRR